MQDTYTELINQGHAFNLNDEFDYCGQKYYIENIDEEDLIYPYETYPVEIREKLKKALNEPSEDYENEYYDLVAEYRACMSERDLFELKIASLEKEIAKNKGIL